MKSIILLFQFSTCLLAAKIATESYQEAVSEYIKSIQEMYPGIVLPQFTYQGDVCLSIPNGVSGHMLIRSSCNPPFTIHPFYNKKDDPTLTTQGGLNDEAFGPDRQQNNPQNFLPEMSPINPYPDWSKPDYQEETPLHHLFDSDKVFKNPYETNDRNYEPSKFNTINEFPLNREEIYPNWGYAKIQPNFVHKDDEPKILSSDVYYEKNGEIKHQKLYPYGAELTLQNQNVAQVQQNIPQLQNNNVEEKLKNQTQQENSQHQQQENNLKQNTEKDCHCESPQNKEQPQNKLEENKQNHIISLLPDDVSKELQTVNELKKKQNKTSTDDIHIKEISDLIERNKQLEEQLKKQNKKTKIPGPRKVQIDDEKEDIEDKTEKDKTKIPEETSTSGSKTTDKTEETTIVEEITVKTEKNEKKI